MQQMASDIFVRIVRGMGACRKKPAQPASGTLSWMTPSETLLRLCLGGFGDMKWAWDGGWRLPAVLCQTTSSPGFCPISRAHFRDRKTLRKRVHHKGPPLYNAGQFSRQAYEAYGIAGFRRLSSSSTARPDKDLPRIDVVLSLSMNLQQLKKLCRWMEWQRKQKEKR